MTKNELIKENTELKNLVQEQSFHIGRLQQWIYNVCKYIGENNKMLEDMKNYLEEIK